MENYWLNYIQELQVEYDQLDRFIRFLSTGKENTPMKQLIVIAEDGMETVPKTVLPDCWELLIDCLGSKRENIADELKERKVYHRKDILLTQEQLSFKRFNRRDNVGDPIKAKVMTFGAFVNRGNGDFTVHGDFDPGKEGYYAVMPNPPYGVAIVWYPKELFEEIYMEEN